MGAKYSKGVVRHELRDVLPRNWTELELFYTRYQHEVFRRKTSDPQCQFFITFPVFRILISGIHASSESHSSASAASTDDSWREKELLLRAFQCLDRKRKQRIAAMDFFAGLVLITNAKKSIKVEFLFSLLDNGGLKTLNECEVTMVLGAAARGLVMFKANPPVDEHALRPLARRLLGEAKEATRASLVEKTLTDTEIVFFMNDLDNEAATTSDALLAQQARLMKSLAANEVQLGRGDASQRTGTGTGGGMLSTHLRPTVAPLTSIASTTAKHGPSCDAMLRRLQAALQPPPPLQQPPPPGGMATERSAGAGPRAANVNAAKRVDARSLCRLVQAISDGALQLTHVEAKSIVSCLSSDDFGYVKSSDVLRAMRAWVLRSSMDAPAVWESCARITFEWLDQWKSHWLLITGFCKAKMKIAAAAKAAAKSSSAHDALKDREDDRIGAEISYSLKARISQQGGGGGAGGGVPKARDPAKQDTKALRFRLHIHQRPVEEAVLPGNDDAASENPASADQPLSFVVEFGLNRATTEEQEMDLALAVAHFLTDEDVKRHVRFAVDTCAAAVVDGRQQQQLEQAQTPPSRCLRVTFHLNANVFDHFEQATSVKVARLLRNCFVSIDFTESLNDLVFGAQQAASLLPQLVKQEVRQKVLAENFTQFDMDKDGRWNLQEFNAFQQARRGSALDDSAFLQCFGARREIPQADVVACFQQCSQDELRLLLGKVGRGTLSSQLHGECSATVTLDEHQLKRLESQFSELHWGDKIMKKMTFLCRSVVDASCDLHCRSFVDVLKTIGVAAQWENHLESPTFIVEWVKYLKDLLGPKHGEHGRDFVCGSVLCSLDTEISKTPHQLELEDQQRNLPRGTRAHQVKTLRKAYYALTAMRDHVTSLERLAIVSPQISVECEIDNCTINV